MALGWAEVFFLKPLAGVDKQFLSGVQKGFEGGGGFSREDLLLAVLILLALILIVILLRGVFRPKRLTVGQMIDKDILDPARIREIIQRSIDLRAIYDLEVHDQAYGEIYKCPVMAINREGEVEVEMTVFTDLSLDFRDKEVSVSFRMSRLGQQEFYRFDTYSSYLGLTDIRGRKEKSVRLKMPIALAEGQKRRFLRVEPRGRYAFKAALLSSSAVGEVLPVRGFQVLHEAAVRDFSMGGLQMVVTMRGADLRIVPQQEVLVRFSLPRGDLDVDLSETQSIVQGKILEIQRLTRGRRVMSKLADDSTVGPQLVRVMFTGRGQLNKQEKVVTFRPATAMLFEDFHRWILAFQRRMIQEEKGILPKPSRVTNAYPRKPLNIEPKYPSQPLRREDGE